MTRVSKGLAVICSVLLATPASASFVIRDPSNSIVAIGIQDVVVGTTHYDVDFSNSGRTFNEIFGSTEPPSVMPTFYEDAAGASAARDAIIAALNAAGGIHAVGAHPTIGNYFDVPTKSGADPATNFLDLLGIAPNFDPWHAGGVLPRNRETAILIAIPVFTPRSVPEPASIVLGTVLAAVVTGRRLLACRRA
jgi:hypothetical protein